MAITTQAGLIAGLQQPVIWIKAPPATPGGTNRLVSTWLNGSSTLAGTYPNTMSGVTCDKSSTGALPFFDPASGNTYLAGFRMNSSIMAAGYVILCDRLWHNSGTTSGTPNIDVTVVSPTAQTITSPTWPARDINGATTGDGVLLMVECASTMGAGTPNIQIGYTNSSNVAGRTANNIYASITASPAGVIIPMALQNGDTGVKSVESITLSSSYTSGGLSIVAYRPIGIFELPTNGMNCQLDALNMNMPQLYNGTCHFFIASQGNTATGSTGTLLFSQG